MSTELTWLGHGTWLIETGGHRLILDPFLDDQPTAPCKASDVDVEFILVSHGHFDHVSDVASIAERTGALLISNYEICQWFADKHGITNNVGMNLGGATQQPFGHAKMTLAHHSSTLPDGTPAGNPGGFLLTLEDNKKVYFACDTALFLDMKLIGTGGLDLAVLPIGDLFTMGPEDAVEATRLLEPKRVAPAHYNTFPPIEQDAAAWTRQIEAHTKAEPIVLKPGGKISL